MLLPIIYCSGKWEEGAFFGKTSGVGLHPYVLSILAFCHCHL